MYIDTQVLKALQQPLFEPINHIQTETFITGTSLEPSIYAELHICIVHSHQPLPITVLLVALTSTSRVSEMQALSIASSFFSVFQDKIILKSRAMVSA